MCRVLSVTFVPSDVSDVVRATPAMHVGLLFIHGASHFATVWPTANSVLSLMVYLLRRSKGEPGGWSELDHMFSCARNTSAWTDTLNHCSSVNEPSLNA